VHADEERRSRHGQELEDPQPDLGDGEEAVIAHVPATGLLRVANKVTLLVSPHALGRHYQDQETEEKDDRKPHFPQGRRILVHPAQQGMEEIPIHCYLKHVAICGKFVCELKFMYYLNALFK
uniref:Uncharacterized protein n=1 Tax=Callorhinchus milii TaxID=7868 RepID=A0A4W3JFC4_CALMI